MIKMNSISLVDNKILRVLGTLKKKIRYIGYFVTLISLIFIFYMVSLTDFKEITLKISPFTIGLIIFFLVLHMLIMVILSYPLKNILEFISDSKISFYDVIEVNIKSNIVKYFPGNFMQYIGRNFLGKQKGWMHTHIAIGSVVELGFIFLTSIIIVILFSYNEVTFFMKDSITYNLDKIMILTMIAILALFLLLYLCRRYIKIKNIVLTFFTKKFLILFLKSFISYSAIFLIIGTIFAMIYSNLVGNSIQYNDYIFIIKIFLLSWIAGFIIPGASGGIGIRESILVIFLAADYGEAHVLVSAVILRIISIVAEILSFIAVIIIEKYKKRSQLSVV